MIEKYNGTTKQAVVASPQAPQADTTQNVYWTTRIALPVISQIEGVDKTTKYTCPSNGLFIVRLRAQGRDSYIYIYVNNWQMAGLYGNNENDQVWQHFPVNKGDVISFRDGGGMVVEATFVPIH